MRPILTPLRALPLLLLALLAFPSPTLLAQELRGVVVDATDGAPVPQAVVRERGRMEAVQTDSAGRFRLRLHGNGGMVEVSRVGYSPTVVDLSQGPRAEVTVRLQARAALPEVVITAGASRVLRDKTLHLYDYAFLDEGIVAIVYDRARRHSQLAYIGTGDTILTLTDTPEPPGKLVTDCLGQVHAITRHHACQLFLLPGTQEIGYYVDSLEVFERYVTPCLGSVAPYYYYREDRFNGQVVDYRVIDAQTLAPEVFLHLMDREKIHQMMDPLGPYVSFASTEEGMLSIPPAIWDKINKLNWEMQFDRLAFFYPINAPLRVVGGEVLVFDHTNGLLRRHRPDGSALDSVAIRYHKLPHWGKDILVDPVRGEAYTTFEQHGFTTLHKVDLRDGSLGPGTELPKRFPSRIELHDGVAYFLYKETDYDDTNRLWRMALGD